MSKTKSKILYYWSDLIAGDKTALLVNAIQNFLTQAPTMLVVTDAKGHVLAYVPSEAKEKMMAILEGEDIEMVVTIDDRPLENST